MPGLSQLKQFNKDIQSLGDEITLRATRGEKPIVVPIPKGITVEDDSEDFVLGMPDNPRVVDNSNVDEDLSEITGITPASGKSDSSADAGPSFEAPDMSSLLAPVDLGGDDSSGAEMPDLSQFMDAPVEEEEPEIVEEEPEEISVADMGLEALLAGAGFDGTEGAQTEEEPVVEEEPETDENDLSVDYGETPKQEEKNEVPFDTDGLDDSVLADIMNTGKVTETPEPAAEPVEDFEPIEDFETAEPLEAESPAEPAEPAENIESAEPVEELGELDDLDSLEEMPESSDSFDLPEVNPGSFEEAEPFEMEDADSSDIPQAPADFGDAAEDLEAPEGFEAPADLEAPEGFEAPADLEAPEGFEAPADLEAPSDFEVPEDLGDMPEMGDAADLEAPEDLGEAGDLEAPEDFGEAADLEAPEDLGEADDLESPDEPSVSDLFNAQDVELPDMNSTFEEIPDYDTGDESGEGEAGEGGDDFAMEDAGPIETFDTSGMDMDEADFGIQDTDSQLDSGSHDFELDDGNISMEGSDFEIPGFSDVQSAPAVPKSSKKTKGLDEPDFSGALPGAELPPNTLSDEQYKQFLKNLSEYPLNVRLAFEDLIVQDEFTDDAEFEIIEKILRKAPARQVASTLEKMLDTSIPVPRDFEHRTAEEYEAYKKSLSYQLKNKVLPGLLCGILLLLVSWGLFNFAKNCIYIPAKASKLYKQGYALLQADEYVQSQIKFDEAATYQLKKKWFFNFARGYREHKQYQRAADIYGKLLIYFNHDKTAGLEYADMELTDLENYERAEEITRREILDYHINDPDGILMLGDIFLEWGTEKDPEKLDLAKEQYLTLIQLYKPNDLYNSRMMRYYMRSDNLQQVLNYKNMFEEQKKTKIDAADWTELGGYLLEKLYGSIAPSEEYLRYQIEGLLRLLKKSVDLDDSNPIAWYNLGNYYVQTNDSIDNVNQCISPVKILPTDKAPSRASRYTEKGNVLFSMVRPYLRNIAMVTEADCIASTGFYVCRQSACLDSWYCYYLMTSQYVVDGLNQFMKGDNSPSINKGHIDDYLFPLPPLNEQQRIVAKVDELFSVIEKIQQSLEA